MAFVHLHAHTDRSLLDGAAKISDYIVEVVRHNQSHLAITDHGNCDCFLEFQKEALKQSITPIFGVEFYIVPDITKKEKYEKKYHITVLVQNKVGFSNLLKMLTIANLEGHYYRPRIDPSVLLKHYEGLVFMTACVSSFINMEGGTELLLELHKKAPTYLELMPHNYPIQKEINLKKLELGKKYNIQFSASNDAHYAKPEHAQAQEMLLAIQKKAKWDDPKRWKFDFGGLYLKSEQEMEQAFIEQNCVPKEIWRPAMDNTMEIAKLCENFKIRKRKVSLPKVYGYEHRDETELMREIIESGLKERKIGDYDTYRNRIEEEFEIICKLNFQRYFLIVWELIDWCKKNGIGVGPCRGSSGGSLICYLMHITDIDPIKYGLIFARFISIERNDLPDIDVDYEDIKREEVKKHLRDCYGEYNVAGISTFLTLKGRGALRDVARVFDLPLREVDLVAKEIETKLDGDKLCGHTIEEACKKSEIVASFKKKYPETVQLAIDLEGQTKAVGQHAAGVVVSSDDLRKGERCNLCIRSGEIVVNWDKEDAEQMGLMKLDVLGLTSLTIINSSKKFIKENYDIDIELDKLTLDDKEIYEEISKGNNVGLFQLNSHGLTGLCKEMGVKEFNDIVLATAIFRPGVLGSGMADEYIKRRKNKKEIKYIHPKLKKYTKDTLGIVLYQEQVMWVMYELASLPWSVCDKVRKVMGKSQGDAKFQKFKQQFIDGCKNNKTLSEKEADKVWDTLASFSKYGFNLSHATAYSMITYYCAYLKYYYPKEFLCACLTYGGEDKKAEYVNEARRLGLEVSLPKIDKSLADVWYPNKDSNIIYAPLTEIKGVGKTQAEKIIEQGLNKKVGFFTIMDQSVVPTNSTDELLNKVGFYKKTSLTQKELTKARQYLNFNPLTGMNRFSRLPKDLGYSDDDIIKCNLEGFEGNLIEIKKYVKKIECDKCELRKEARSPVSSSFGRYNIMVLGESPWVDEDLEGIGFVGKTGKEILWPEFKKHGLHRDMFHVSNIIKCKVRNPSKKQIPPCSHHIIDEIENLKPILILAFGNTNVRFFKDQDGGIMKLNAETEWSDKYRCWICWSIHPSAVIYHDSENRPLFEKAIKNFADKINMIGGNWLRKNKEQKPNKKCPYSGKFGIDNNEYEECSECKIWFDCTKIAMNEDFK
jgi:DNA polymerase-3 subunit alpha